MSATDEQEDLLTQLKDLMERKQALLASIDTKIAKMAGGLPAEKSTHE